jgi:hypothetical protein
MMNDSVGYICGASGVILKTLNGGGYLTTGINENISLQNDFTIYGNPSHDEIKIETEYTMQNAELKIFNSIGQEIEAKKNISGKIVSVNTSGFSEGVYLFEINSLGKNTTGRFVIE